MQHVRVATYAITNGTADDVFGAGRDGMLPVFEQQPGLLGYGLADDGNGTILSISRWETRQSAQDAAATAAEWVKDNLADRVSLLSSYVGDFGLYVEA